MGKNVWVKPIYNRSEINRAGKILISDENDAIDKERAYTVMNNWRMSHSYPLNTFQQTLRNKANKISTDALVAQRLKRASSIISKLERITKMNLARMQDLGGCRAIMPTIEDVYKLQEEYKRSRFKHKLINSKDYIHEPKSSGYRGIHLIYEFYSDQMSEFNKQQIEIQIRTKLQHAWATAVETAGTFTNQALKSSVGEEGWLRFFALVSSAFAIKESQTPVPGTPEDVEELINEIRFLEESLNVRTILNQYRMAIKTITENKEFRKYSQAYFLILLRPNQGTLDIASFDNNDLESVSQIYLDYEKNSDPGEVVVALVSATSLDALRIAYPNYFLDTEVFVRELEEFLEN